MPSKNTPVPTQSPELPVKLPVEHTTTADTIALAKHHLGMSSAYRMGADCVNRLGTMIEAAQAIAKSAGSPELVVHRLTKFLGECDFMVCDLAAMLESERDSQIEYATRKEGK